MNPEQIAEKITVLKGAPTAEEVAALAQVLADLAAERRKSGVRPDADLWAEPHHSHPRGLFNPHAFDSAAYF